MAIFPPPRTQILVNVGQPGGAFKLAAIPCDGVGAGPIGIQSSPIRSGSPMALLEPERGQRPCRQRAAIAKLHARPPPSSGTITIDAAQPRAWLAWLPAFYPRQCPAILRFQEAMKLREAAGRRRPSEPHVKNPMIGWRGASRLCRAGLPVKRFALECAALRHVA